MSPLALACSQGIQATNLPPQTPATPFSSPHPPPALAKLLPIPGYLELRLGLEEKMKAKAEGKEIIDTQGTQGSKHSFSSCTNYWAMPSCPHVQPTCLSNMLLMLSCNTMLGEITLFPEPETLTDTWS